MEDPHRKPDPSEASRQSAGKLTGGWRARYQGSFAQDFVKSLGAVDFGNQIIIFGACLLLSVLPLIIVLSAYASHRIQDDIARHLGLSAQGTRVVDGLRRRPPRSTWPCWSGSFCPLVAPSPSDDRWR
jgi:hypothetical protein